MAKQLGEFLQEKQEPFALDVYLVERGYLNSTCKTSNRFKKITLIPNCSKILRSFITKIASFSNEYKPKKSVGGNHNACSDSEVEEAETCASIKAETLEEGSDKYFRDGGDHLSMKEVDKERKYARKKSAEESNQLSPVSVLEEAEFDDDDGATQDHEKRAQENSSKFERSRMESQDEVTIGYKFIEHYTKNKNALLHSNQLLFYCVREVLENQRPKKEKGGQLQLQKILGAKELWKLIYQNIWLWSKETVVDEANVEQLVHSDTFTNSLKKWNNFEEQTREICIDIATTILEDISNEIITEIINFV